MFAEIMERNKGILAKSDSYLCPQIDKMIDLLRRLESTASYDFYSSIQQQQFAKGDLLLSEGDACKHLWFLESGVMRQYLNINGKEQIGSFFFPGEFIVSNKTNTINIPSKVNIEFGSKSAIFILHLSCLERLKVTNPLLNEIEKLGFMCRSNWLEAHNYFLHSTPVERYKSILNNHPGLLHQIPLKHLSSFMHITPENLSRIRTKVNRKNIYRNTIN